MEFDHNIHKLLELIYNQYHLFITDLKQESESKEYCAYEFKLDDKNIKFRFSKITPNKCGYFVTIWKRINEGPILPFDISDPIDLFIIAVKDKEKFGQFIFPINALFENGYISGHTKTGKRAIRLYPTWTKTDSTAQKTLKWQTNFFIEIEPQLDLDKMKTLLNNYFNKG